MKLTFIATVLAGANFYDHPSGLTVNGEQVYDDAGFLRAIAATYFGRGQKSTTLAWTSQRQFDSLRECEVYILTHFAGLPAINGLLQAEVGQTGDTQICYLENAVIATAVVTEHRGVSCRVQYTIKGGVFTTDVPDDVPGEADTEEGFIVLRRGAAPVDSATSTGTVTFSAPLPTTPFVVGNLQVPPGGDNIWGWPIPGTETVNGFDYQLTAPVPDGTYKFSYIAIS